MPRDVEAVPEHVVRLRVNGLLVDIWTCTPEALEALGAGRLRALGFIRHRDDIVSLRATRAGEGVVDLEAEIDPAAAAAATRERDHRREHGCGLRFLLDCRPDLLGARPGRLAVPDLEAFPDLFRELFDRSPSRKDAGGHHTAALHDGRALGYVHEEVGRHNAVDKAIGAALLDGADPGARGLVLTARISGGIAATAARAGVAWIASRSVPTTLAAELAAAAGIPMIARAAGRDARVFGAPA
jgi:formate dehydrogenase accessory protein FdhD